ncbi:hypothetical protein K1T35_00825 [Pseudonocardia sp. DSM 110487]|uniref:hypothetical protein n=1 Tax=Pseudonocardia sp. DSM 110487 TaxID=2865833 RepID=UPI001C6A58A8|nr:hypothetical protein [Pseudonocardia sp. DSM 110487]QYN35944.1 hypothetical protein K1T35_00825 [Pseudonocardia sp. DSM 110487]
MIHEAAVFQLADLAAVHAFTLVGAEDMDSVLPPLFDMPGADQPRPLREVLAHAAYDEAWIPDMLAGRTMDEVGRDTYDGDLLGDDPHGNIARIAERARAAAARVTDRDAVVHCGYGDVPAWDYFWQLNVARTLAAHDIARHLGAESPVSEELAKAMWEGTAPAADMWRSFGIYREEVPVRDGASWRARYLGLTGRKES